MRILLLIAVPVASLGVAALLPRSEPLAPVSAETCRLGQALRAEMGLGPQEMSAIGATAPDFEAVATAAEQFYDENRSAIEGTHTTARDARLAAFRAYEIGAGDVSGEDRACKVALLDLLEATSPLVETVSTELTKAQRDALKRRMKEPLLDAALCLLVLTDQQGSDLLAAQRARDRILRHHKLRKNPKAVQGALGAYETRVAEILTPEQQAERQAAIAQLADGLAGFMAMEESRCPEGP